MKDKITVFTRDQIGGSLDIENYCTLRLFFVLFNFSWPQSTKLTRSRCPVASPDIIAYQIDVFPV